MNLITIFLLIYFAHNSFAQLPPRVTSQSTNQQRQLPGSDDLSINSIRRDITALRQTVERVDFSNNQIVNAIKNYRIEMEEVKKSLNKVQEQCLENQIFNTPAVQHENPSSLEKLATLSQMIIKLSTSMGKIERELIAMRKSSRKSNSNFSMMHQRNLHHGGNDIEEVCTATDTEPGIKKFRKNFFISCENVEDEGNWILIQSRFNGDVNFFRSWNEYKEGFGSIGGEFWMGLERLHDLTSTHLYELMITIEDFKGEKRFAKYAGFAVSSEAGGYALNVLGKYSGDAGDALTYHAGMKFSTYDADNDEWSDGSCAKSHMGGWWFRQCDESNLNGVYFPDGKNPTQSNDYAGMHWKTQSKTMTTLKSVKMMIRPIE